MLALEGNSLSAVLGAPLGSDIRAGKSLSELQGRGIELLLNSSSASENPTRIFYYEQTKRAVDILGAFALLIVLSPLILVVALAIKLTSPGAVIFKQTRLTVGNRKFTMFKFRSMTQDAEAGTGAVWAAERDPRVTTIGRFIRLTRIDELPQLVNVLMGDMSLIGPRPERPEFAEQLEQELPSFHRRLEVKAGITGLAQVAGGYASSIRSYRRKLALDIKYIEHRSLLLDLGIALKTIIVVLTGTGAR